MKENRTVENEKKLYPVKPVACDVFDNEDKKEKHTYLSCYLINTLETNEQTSKKYIIIKEFD